MYWFREGDLFSLVPWLLVLLSWWLGGWLVAAHAFRLERTERLAIGFGLGMAGYLWFSNLLGHWLSPWIAFSASGLIMLAVGVVYAWRDGRPWLDRGDLRIWPGSLMGLALLGLFLAISRGLAIFDEPKNLTITSLMAVGDIPPHYYINSQFYFRYHYGFQLLGSTLMRLGGMFPWSAFDLAKSIVFAYALLLAGLLGKRYIHHPVGVLAVPVILAFASGTRYLLMLLPSSLLQHIDPLIVLQGTSAEINAPFSRALFMGWTLDGGPPVPFPFGFLNGLLYPLVMAHTGSYSLSVILLELTLLLAPRQIKKRAIPVLGILLALWAIAWESSYGLFVAGALTVSLYQVWQQRSIWKGLLRPEHLAVLLSVPLVLLQGGTLTEIARKVLLGSASAGIGVEGTVESTGFSLRWPPAVFSSHLGPLDITTPLTILVAICEIGPVILLTPWITRWAWQRLRDGEWATGALIFSAWVGFLGPLVLVYQAERDISRFTGHALLVWTLFLAFLVLERNPSAGRGLRIAGIVSLLLMILGGVVVFRSEFSAVTRPVLGYQLTGLDARVASQVWNRLPPESEIFDSSFWRASALTGLKTRVAVGRSPTPDWLALNAQPTPASLLEAGYRYVYLDDVWWDALPKESLASFSEGCVQTIAEYWDAEKVHFRRLLDLAGCSP